MSSQPRRNISTIYSSLAFEIKEGIEERLKGNKGEISLGAIRGLKRLLETAHDAFYIEGYPGKRPVNITEALEAQSLIAESYSKATQRPYPSIDEQERIIRDMIFWTNGLETMPKIAEQVKPHYKELAKILDVIAQRGENERYHRIHDDDD